MSGALRAAAELTERSPPLGLGAVAFAGLAVVCALALLADAPAITGAHPALKPLKFAISIAVFLGTLAIVVPSLHLGPAGRRVVEALALGTMAVEMAVILLQAWRGLPSHFNVAGPLNSALWNVMMGAIVMATLTMAGVAIVATARPLEAVGGGPMEPALALAWRAGLWLFLLTAVSGFAMGGRGAHTVGGPDGGAGLPLLGWSLLFGDLRVSHFVAMHALQALPLAALAARRLPWLREHDRAFVLTVALACAILCLGTLAQALSGRPLAGPAAQMERVDRER